MLTVVNPATEEIVKQLVEDTEESIATKITVCRKAQDSWRQSSLEERISVIHKFGRILQENAEQCAYDTSLETGRPVHQIVAEIRATDARIQYFCNRVAQVMRTQQVYRDDSVVEELSWEPLGLIANISAWNYPYFVGCNVFIPALLTGNGVIYKASEHACLTGGHMTRLLSLAGIPEGVFQEVLGAGDVGSMVLSHDLGGVFFTGSFATGQKINEMVSARLMRVGLELGGKDPCYVSDDVDIATVAPLVADGAFYNCGQSCCAVERIYVHEKIYQPFLKKFISSVQSFKTGNPLERQTYLGPLTRKQQISVLQRQVDDALKKGASIQLGGREVESRGYYFEPTVLIDVNHSMEVMMEESFGPIVGIQRVSSDQEALELCNHTSYGLTASVYCREDKRLRKMLSQLNSGTVYGNCCDRVSPYVPWSGRQRSGIGSTLGELGIQAFLQPKSWQIRR